MLSKLRFAISSKLRFAVQFRQRWGLAFILISLSACGFLRDNKKPSLVYDVQNSADSERCEFLFDYSSTSVNVSADCAAKKVAAAFDKIRPLKAGELQDFEIQALLNHFLKTAEEPDFSLSDARAVIKFKVLLMGGSSSSVERSALDGFIQTVRDVATILPKTIIDPTTGISFETSPLPSLLAKRFIKLSFDKITSDDALQTEDVVGLFHLARHFKALRNLKGFENISDANATFWI